MNKDVDDLLGAVLTALADGGETPTDEDNLFEWGLDSITLMRVANQWRRDGITVSFAQLSKNPTLRGWRAVLSEQLGAAEESAVDDEVAAPAVAGEPFPLAPMQHAYWIGRTDEVALGSVAAHLYVEFDGSDVDPAALEAAVRALVDRHDMLRAVFTDNGLQRIADRREQPALVVHDLRDAEDTDTELERLRQERSHARLDVERGEVFAILLTLLPGGRTRLHVDVDMLAADALSYRVMLADLARLYERPAQPPAPIGYSYQSYLAARPQRREESRALARQWWQQRVPDLPSAPDLPLVPVSRQQEPSRVTRRHHWLSPDDRKRLTVGAHRHGLTPAMVVATAFAEILGAWSGRPRFLLNVPMFDREDVHPDVGTLLGDFTSSVLLDVDLTERRSFVEDAGRLQERMHTDAAHADYSGVEVLRDLSRHHGEQVMAPVVFTSALNLGELFDESVRRNFGDPVWIISQGPQVVLDAQVTEVAGGLLVNWDVREHAFPEGLTEAMFDAFLGLLTALGEDEAAWLGPVAALLPPSQADVRQRVNATGGPRSGRLLADGFFDRAAAGPETTALCWGTDGELSYGELADRALRVARSLVDAGVAPGEPVAVSLPKGPEQIVAVLGVLAAGGTYVPIGVEQPEARRNRIRDVAGVRHTLTDVDAALRGEPLAQPVRVDQESPAYVLFTSGSTGEPKGVEVPHRAAVNTIDDLNERFLTDAELQPRCLAVSALDFDLSVYDIFGLLAAGGAVVLVAEGDRKDADRWADLARTHRVTLVNCVPALLDMLLRAAGPGDLASLRTVLLGGDWVGTDLPGRVAEAAPACRFAGLGGTTETAIHSTVFEVDDPGAVPDHWRSIPYGTPLRNVRCRVVDARGRDCPDWVTGELWIGGDGVALGYRADPARTADKFVTHDGTRWYRTGDLARYRPDGTLEFLGRSDHQVKVRGMRIELGEVESALAEHDSVRGAVAGVSGGQLVAAVSSLPGTVTDGSARDWLRTKLPPHMVPARVVVVDELPLTHNGKIDRRAVAALWPAGSGVDGVEHAEPGTALEKVIARVWSDVLRVERIGVDDPFFAIGGDSVLATQIVAALREALDTDRVSVRALFSSPTVGRLAGRLVKEETEPGRLEQVAEIYLEVAELSAEEIDAQLSS